MRIFIDRCALQAQAFNVWVYACISKTPPPAPMSLKKRISPSRPCEKCRQLPPPHLRRTNWRNHPAPL